MNKLALTFSLLTAAVLMPTGAFAHDKHKDDYAAHQAQLEADRRANGYYNPPVCAPVVPRDYCAPRFETRYRFERDRNCVFDDRGGVWVRVR